MVAGVSSTGVHGLPPLRTGLSVRARSRDSDQQASDDPSNRLTEDQQRQVQELKRIDASVRQHEAAHQAAGGPHAGGASFTFTRGPDGKNYATAGEVQVDVSAERDPESTIRKMETVKAAALAPSDPSSQDLRVAQQADAAKMQAQQESRRKGSQQGASGSGSAGGQDGGQDHGSGSDTAAPALAARGAAAYAAAFGIGRRTGTAGFMV
ncbi:putative metalloprotease CJM1_0395 family protein [Roseomonas genomospecies 6]|uniref:Catalase n=1 Tax=Roseomonas genomospecies 6 TaxID=214106 RepID=A0A9W7KSU5_9PROT|nr:putative metalloprotease CJM1_0395 family protein [Roseomonas genomospecies 6]KAA0678062.1 hypothetical protein DS843_20985 [Roseomonas genomospecies 6]